MSSGVSWWSEQFWISITTTSLSILASVGVAVGLYFLKRWHDRYDGEAKEQAALIQQLGDRINSHADEVLGRVPLLSSREAFLMNMRMGFTLNRFETIIHDPNIKEFCEYYARMIIDYWVGDAVGEVVRSEDQSREMFGLSLEMPKALGKCMKGEPLEKKDYSFMRTNQADAA